MNIDWNEVEVLEKFFSNFSAQVLAQHPCRIDVGTLLNWLYSGQKVLILDIRTPNEYRTVKLTLENSLWIPMNELFKRENIKKLTQYGDHKIVVACRSGVRSLVATAFLQRVGFRNVYSLEGGITAIVSAVPYGD